MQEAPAATFDLPLIQQASGLRSKLDHSVNFVATGEFPGAIEARYVRREAGEVIVYVSSQTGCAKACRFCHLTQSGQTDHLDLPTDAIVAQARRVLEHYDTLVEGGEPVARTVNFNFMARGEVFANPLVRADAPGLLDALTGLARSRLLVPRFKLSTIMPVELSGSDLAAMFGGYSPDVYYSLYSVDPGWRRRWMPKAMPADQALGMLADYQQVTRKVPVVHFALIDSENATVEQMTAIARAIRQAGLRCDINLVRYNPFSGAQGREAPEPVMEACAARLASELPASRVQIVGRVGHDVNASCGMFVAGRGAKRAHRQAAGRPLASTRSKYFGFGAAT